MVSQYGDFYKFNKLQITFSSPYTLFKYQEKYSLHHLNILSPKSIYIDSEGDGKEIDPKEVQTILNCKSIKKIKYINNQTPSTFFKESIYSTTTPSVVESLHLRLPNFEREKIKKQTFYLLKSY